ncbi:MAG: L,D-transpeptidase [Verrucomicrobiota bacterium]
MPSHFRLAARLFSLLLISGTIQGRETVREAITFDASPGKVYVPMEEALAAFRWQPAWDSASKSPVLNGVTIPASLCRTLPDGGLLVSDEALAAAGVERIPLPPDKQGPVIFRQGRHRLRLTPAVQRAEVSLRDQKLRGWQGDRLVFESRVSSGRQGRTPAGKFRAGPYKARQHYSSRYHNAPMPWSVQINGHIFVHGFTSVPNYPASHGCIRVPLNEGNPARFFYEWVHRGTPVTVTR